MANLLSNKTRNFITFFFPLEFRKFSTDSALHCKNMRNVSFHSKKIYECITSFELTVILKNIPLYLETSDLRDLTKQRSFLVLVIFGNVIK